MGGKKAAALDALRRRLLKQYGQPYAAQIDDQIRGLTSKAKLAVEDIEEVENLIRDSVRGPRSQSGRSRRSQSSRSRTSASGMSRLQSSGSQSMSASASVASGISAGSAGARSQSTVASRAFQPTFALPSKISLQNPNRKPPQLWDLIISYDKQKHDMEERARMEHETQTKQHYKRELDDQMRERKRAIEAEHDERERDRQALQVEHERHIRDQEAAQDRQRQKAEVTIQAQKEAEVYAKKKREKERRQRQREREEMLARVTRQDQEERENDQKRRERLMHRAAEMRDYVHQVEQDKKHRKREESELEKRLAEQQVAAADAREAMRQAEQLARKERLEMIMNSMGDELERGRRARQEDEDARMAAAWAEAERRLIATEQQKRDLAAAQSRDVINTLGVQMEERRRKKIEEAMEAREQGELWKQAAEEYYQSEIEKDQNRRAARADLDKFLQVQAMEQVMNGEDARLLPNLDKRELQTNKAILKQMERDRFAPMAVDALLKPSEDDMPAGTDAFNMLAQR